MSLVTPAVGDSFYIPFWVLLEYLDTTPSDPFISAKILNIKTLNATTSDGHKLVQCCDIECLSHQGQKMSFTVCNVPVEYLIRPDSLRDWADKISKWFIGYVDNIQS